jgi:hypothetical protein
MKQDRDIKMTTIRDTTQEYKPTKKEVFNEILNEFKSKSIAKSKSITNRASKAGKSLKDFGKVYVVGTALMAGMPYAIPTYARSFKEAKENPSYFETNAEDTGANCGFITGTMVDIGQFLGYVYAVSEDHPEALLIPLATNVLSGAYEIGRNIYKNTEKKLIEKHNIKNLESEVTD